jgi:hypothetical protein
MSDLIPCPGCHRHVESHETSCPFCRVALSPTRPCTGACSGLPAARLARAALVAAGAALLGAACSSQSAIVPYGVSPFPDAGTDSPQDAGAPADGSPDADDADK